ncbi:MAG: TerB family tellurite resistance protein [Odoribacteraceae bacterium]|jgi:DnaJ like chaperone protein|nr:TerB family tellurite resistance protein [Odoribacteraceae bacterium]
MLIKGRWIGAGLGFALGGPIGALLGFVIGTALDTSASSPAAAPSSRPTGRADFLYSLVILATAIMKADGKITRDELNHAKQFFRENFGQDGEREALAIIRQIMDKEIRVDQICLQIRQNMPPKARVQLLYFLFGLAKADGRVCDREMAILDRIADLLGLDATTYRSIRSMFREETDSAYAILGIPATATDEEVKKAYRRAALAHHPDKVGYMGDDIRLAAEKKFTTINNAYDKIKRERGL